MRFLAKLDEFFKNELSSDISEVLITCDSQGKYSLFGKYTILPNKNGNYLAFTSKHTEEYEFSTLINATAWCTLHNSKNFNEAKRIISLDMRLASINVDIENFLRLHDNALTSSTKLMYAIKIEEAILKKNLMLDEIRLHINKSKHIQECRFITNRQKNRYLR
jgi:hypothetical protein